MGDVAVYSKGEAYMAHRSDATVEWVTNKKIIHNRARRPNTCESRWHGWEREHAPTRLDFVTARVMVMLSQPYVSHDSKLRDVRFFATESANLTRIRHGRRRRRRFASGCAGWRRE